MIFDICSAEKIIGYTFDNPALLEQAFTHSSYVNEHSGIAANERLEFLGDCILNFLVGERLFEQNPSADEGDLSAKRAALVSRAPLARLVDGLGLIEYLIIGAGVNKSAFSIKNRSNLFEAIIGAIYLDGGLEKCRGFLENNFYSKVVPEYDYKSMLQRKCGDCFPIYNTSECKHGFIATVKVAGGRFAGEGTTKHEAEIAAAKSACASLFGVD